MPVDRLMPNDESRMLIDMVRDFATNVMKPQVNEMEANAELPRDVFRQLGELGLLSLPYPEEFGGGGQPYEVYLQVVEELATAWMSVAVGVSVHSLTINPVHAFGTDEQKERMLHEMLGGSQLGAYALSEPEAGSDVANIQANAARDGDTYTLNGTKSWISHAGHADFYTLFARTSDDGPRGLSCFIVPSATEGMTFPRQSGRWAWTRTRSARSSTRMLGWTLTG